MSKARRVVLLDIDSLLSHEMTEESRLSSLKEEILRDGFLRRPILVDEKTRVIIDGHHRLKALKELGCRYIPAVLIDYLKSDVCVEPWRDCDRISKDLVIKSALSGRLLPPKTTRHVIFCEGCKRHVEFLEGEVNIPLSELMDHARSGRR